ncbi:hypothetical protein [Yinghuangia soli]|uniref:DUF732 domain-containing protein n=1 Tax=Yinghuangia soli TaxID=2908204 RepID=A0AA41U2G2_9ACTN|nr:hypothetical protein [Yinghuangia soli]MCF2531763.1 hypothetical protein [Yinghuangia soli]
MSSQQPWGPQQPEQYPYQPQTGAYGAGPSWGPPPPPPQRTPMAVWIVAAVVIIVALVVAVSIVGGDDDDESSPPTARVTATQAGDGLTAEQRASILAEAGYPPEPDATTWAAYIRDLKAIDPDIVHGKEEKAVDRGRNQCRSIKDHKGDRTKLVDLTNQRFSSPDHPEGFGLSKASRILDVVHQHLCPTY